MISVDVGLRVVTLCIQVDTNVSEEHTTSVFIAEVNPSGSHGIRTQKTNTDIFSAVRTSNLVL
jgi:hypothetical protein